MSAGRLPVGHHDAGRAFVDVRRTRLACRAESFDRADESEDDVSHNRPDWIESAGGPLVVVPNSGSGDWRGVEGDDYTDACAVNGFLGRLARPSGDVLVLGDEPMRTAVVTRHDGPAIIRWMYAPSEQQLLELAFGARLDGLGPVEVIDVELRDEPYVIFDSGAPGATAQRIQFRPPSGRRRVRTYVIEDAERSVGIVVHRFDS